MTALCLVLSLCLLAFGQDLGSCIPSSFPASDILKDQTTIQLLEDDLQTRSWSITDAASVGDYTNAVAHTLDLSLSQRVQDAITAAVNRRIANVETGVAGLSDTKRTIFKACLELQKATFEALVTEAETSLDAAFLAAYNIAWPTVAWTDLIQAVFGTTNTQIILDNWVTAFTQQLTKRVVLIQAFIFQATKDKVGDVVDTIDDLITYIENPNATNIETLRLDLESLVESYIKLRRIQKLLQRYQTRLQDEVKDLQRKADAFLNHRSTYYRDFVNRFLAVFPVGTHTISGALLQHVLDHFEGLGVTVDIDIQIVVAHDPLANNSLTITVSNIEIPGFLGLQDPAATALQVQRRIVNYLAVQFLLDLQNVAFDDYVLPVKRASGDILSPLTFSTQSSASGLVAGLFVALFAFLFHF